MKMKKLMRSFEDNKEDHYKKLLAAEKELLKKIESEKKLNEMDFYKKVKWTDEMELKLQNVKTTLAVEGLHLTDRELAIMRKHFTGEITDEQYLAWCKGERTFESF